MRVELKKQPQKYMAKCTQSDCDKIDDILTKLENPNNLRGKIIKLKGSTDEYRVSSPPFRIIYTYDRVSKVIIVTKIDTRGDVYKKG